MKLIKKEVKKMDMKKYSTILIGLFLLTQGVFAATTATRTMQSSAAPGASVPVSLSVTMGSGVLGCGLIENIPAGWTVSNVGTGVLKTSPDRIEWIFFTGSALPNEVVSYTITVPASASGTYTFLGTVMPSGAANSTVTGQSTVSVVAPTTSTTSTTTTTMPGVYVQRNMASTAKVGVNVPVTLAINVDESKTITSLGVREIVPSGWAVSSVSNGGVYTSSSHKIEWVFGNYSGGNEIKDRSITYTITVPTGTSTGTVGSFSGEAKFYEAGVEKSSAIAGVSTLTVAKKTSNNDEFTVTLPSTAVTNEGITITVTDKDSNRPVKDAAVRVYLGKDDTGKKVKNGMTDENGTFTFTLSAAGQYAIVTEKSRYKDLTKLLTVSSGVVVTTTTVAPVTTTTRAVTTTMPEVSTTSAPATTMAPTTTVAPATTVTTVEVTTTVEETTTTTPAGGGGGNNMLLILVVVIIIVAAVAYFMMKGKGKTSGNGKAAAEKPKKEKTEAKEE